MVTNYGTSVKPGVDMERLAERLQARVKELEEQRYILCEQVAILAVTNGKLRANHASAQETVTQVSAENERLRRVVDAARKYLEATKGMTAEKDIQLIEALRELDGEKKPLEEAKTKSSQECDDPGCVCYWHD